MICTGFRCSGTLRFMAVIAAPIAMRSTFPLGLGILVVIVLLAALVATGYLIGREYVNGRWDRRDWN
jgi:hypothetical protein